MTIDGIGDSLVKLGVLEKGFGLAKMLDEGINFLANQVFNPEETKKKGEADIQAAKDQLNNLENQLAGHRQAVKNIDKKARDEANAAAQKQAEKEKEAADKKAAQEKKDAEERLARKERERKAQEETDNTRLDAEEALAEEIFQAGLSAQDKELRALDDYYFQRKELAKVYGLDATALVNEQAAKEAEIIKKYQDEADAKQKEADEKIAADKKKVHDMTLDVAAQTLQGLSALTELFAGKSKKQQEKAFKFQKAISIAGAVIDTYKGANLALATYPAPFGAIAAGATIAIGLANIAKIKAQQFNGGGSSGGGGGSTPSPPSIGGGGGGSMSNGTPTFNPIDTSFINNRPAQTAQAYVLAGSVSNAQDANAKIQDLRRL
jgi:colicin import membrane protein